MNIEYNKEKAVAFIVARLSSSRFPAKHFRQIGDRSIIQWIVDTLRLCKELDEIVIATIAEQSNEPLKDYAKGQGIELFWYEGEIDHVTTRLRKAAELFDAGICVLISGDCPLIQANAIDIMIQSLRETPEADVLTIEPRNINQIFQNAQLQGVNIARKKAWQLADDLSDKPELKEHHFPIIGLCPEKFSVKSCTLPKNLYSKFYRLSVDTMADLEFQNAVYDELRSRHIPFELSEVLNILQEKPELALINSHVYQRKLVENIKKALFIIDAGYSLSSKIEKDSLLKDSFSDCSNINYGYGHLMRSMELAKQMVERVSYPVTFMVDDDKSAELVKLNGFKTLRGSFQSLFEQGLKDIIQQYDLVVIDVSPLNEVVLSCKLKLWREKANLTDKKIVVIDSAASWAKEADLIVIPGVTYKDNQLCSFIDMPNIIYGKENIILRRDIIRAKSFSNKKHIDIIAYLHNEKHRENINEYAKKYNLNIHIVEKFESNFPEQLAKSRLLVSNFGYSFYEALSLNTLPVSWSISEKHSEDALIFYKNIGLPPMIINNENDLNKVLNDALHYFHSHFSNKSDSLIKDGTPLIIEEIAKI